MRLVLAALGGYRRAGLVVAPVVIVAVAPVVVVLVVTIVVEAVFAVAVDVAVAQEGLEVDAGGDHRASARANGAGAVFGAPPVAGAVYAQANVLAGECWVYGDAEVGRAYI